MELTLVITNARNGNIFYLKEAVFNTCLACDELQMQIQV
jgi:hypothetical protein